MAEKKIRIGDMLVQEGAITSGQLDQALAEQKRTGQKLGAAIVSLGFLEEDRLLQLLSDQLQIPFIQLKTYNFRSDIVQKLPEAMARRFRALVLADEPDGLLIGMADPLDLFALDELERILQRPVHRGVVRESELLTAMDSLYRRTDEISSLAGELSEELDDSAFDFETIDDGGGEENALVAKLLQSIFEDAVQVKASDIHIEPDEKVLRIRLRIDGVLQEQVMNQKRIAGAMVLRLKLMSNLDISEKRMPQDGRFNLRVKNRNVDVRISTLPSQHGESVVMRLLDQSGGTIDLAGIGMPANLMQRFRAQLQQPHGLILVTGPTGSGKTTTLYGALKTLNTPEKKIITAEDPVEYRLPRITQVQVNEKIGMDFGVVLRSCLRQDPDVLLVGEIRDQETADIALRAALTGHLVLSTLHTNDAISSAMRLIDVGVPGYLVATSLRAVIAQRLVRRICDACGQDHHPTEGERAWLETCIGHEAMAHSFKHGRGCHRCNNTGYRGRIGVFELLEIESSLADALRAEDTIKFGHAAARQPNFRPLAHNAYDYATQGITTLEEVLRVSEAIAEEGVSVDHMVNSESETLES